MNTLIDLNTVYIAASTAKQFGVDLTQLLAKACITESFNEREAKDILKWSSMKHSN